MSQGILLQLANTGLSAGPILVSDIQNGDNVTVGFRNAGPVYVPSGGTSLLVYSGDVAISFEAGAIRKFIDGGYLTGVFVIGSAFATAIAQQQTFPERELATVDSPATQLLTDVVISYDLTAGPGTLSLLPAALWAGRVLRIKKFDNTLNTLTIAADGAELIDGVGTAVFATVYAAVDLYSNGTTIKLLG